MLRTCWGCLPFVVLGIAGPLLGAQSTDELLEKAIYTEETVGDLDRAIEIYGQIVLDAQVAEQAAAEAQFRLGQCLAKQKKTEESLTAFRKVIEDYPDQAEWVAKARQQLPEESPLSLRPVPWEDGEYLQLSVKLAGGLRIGTFIWTVASADLDGKDGWRMKTYRYILAGGDNRGLSLVDADAKDFRPLFSSFQHTLMGTVDGVYEPGKVTVTKPGTDDPARTDVLEKEYYDNEQGVFVFRRLPLAEGYETTVPIYATFGGGKIGIGLEVNGKETVTVPAGVFECYKVTLQPVNQVFWYSADSHCYLVKLEAAGVTAELERMGRNVPGQARPYRNEELGFSLDLPPDWYYLESPSNEDRSAATLHLIDPTASVIHIASVRTLDSIKDSAAKASVQAWAKHRWERGKQELKDLQLRADGFQECTVAGRPAVRVVGDYLAGDKQQIAAGVFVFGEETACEMSIRACDPDQFEAVNATFDKIMETVKLK